VTKGVKGISHEVLWECNVVPASLSSAPSLPKATPGRARKLSRDTKAFGGNFHEPVLKNGIFRMILPGQIRKQKMRIPKFRCRKDQQKKTKIAKRSKLNLNLCSLRCFFLTSQPEGRRAWPAWLRWSLLIPPPRDGHNSWLALPPSANRYWAARLGILTGSLIFGLGASLRHFG
jgi:hypothetical protein